MNRASITNGDASAALAKAATTPISHSSTIVLEAARWPRPRPIHLVPSPAR